MSKGKGDPGKLPFTEADLVGPEDRPKGEWEINMFDWQAMPKAVVKEWLDEMAGAGIRAIQCAPKPEAGVIYVQACQPGSPKSHNVSVSPNHRTVSFSLYTPLLAFDFPKVGDKFKAVFKCRPETYGDVKVLVIEVKGYRVEKVDKATQEVASSLQTPPEKPPASADSASESD